MKLHLTPSGASFIAAIGAAALACASPVFAQGSAGPYVPTPTAIVDEMLKFAEVKRGEYLIDLGSGDGRIVVTAARDYGASGHGIDIQDSLVRLATANARAAGVSDRVHFVRGDLFDADLSRADVVTIYLLPTTAPRLVRKLLADLRPGVRVVSHDYPLSPLLPERYLTFDNEEKRRISGTTLTVLYRYIVPARVAGQWEMRLPTELALTPALLRLEQDASALSGSALIDGREIALADATVKGAALAFGLDMPMRGRVQMSATLNGAELHGSALLPSGKIAWSARRK